MPELQFRDGRHNVPPHLEELMKSIETYKLTYDQAVTAVNRKLMSDYLGQVQAKVTSQHFRGGGR